jgi:RimJ/RimL family protein N-acetyltransferase
VRAPSRATGVIIETERLRMRAHRDDDLADLVVLAGNWEIARWTSTIPHPYSETNRREWIACVQEDHTTGEPRRFAIALKETDRLIGGVGLDGNTGDGSDEPALGYWLGQPYWGRIRSGSGRGRDRLRVPDPRPENDPRLHRPR